MCFSTFHTHVPREAAGIKGEPQSISELYSIGKQNLSQTKVLDYASIIPSKVAIKKELNSYRQVNDEVNSQFEI